MSKAQWHLEKGSPLTVAGAAPTSPRDRKTAKRGTGIPSWLLNLSSAPELSALKERALFLSRWFRFLWVIFDVSSACQALPQLPLKADNRLHCNI